MTHDSHSPPQWTPHTVKQASSTLTAALRRMGVPDSDIPDLVQEVFVVLVRRRDAYPAGLEQPALLWGIAWRLVLHHRRAFARKLRRDRSYAETQASTPPPVDRQTLAELLEPLDDAGELLVLKHLVGMTAKEIGQRVYLNPNTVATRLRRDTLRVRAHAHAGASQPPRPAWSR